MSRWGPWGAEAGLVAKELCLLSSLAWAGSDPPSACRNATGVEGRTPNDALAIRLILFWKALSIPLSPPGNLNPYMSVEPTMGSWRCLAAIGETPRLVTMDLSLLSTVLARLVLLAMCSLKLSLESR